jgi:hypothetical protein
MTTAPFDAEKAQDICARMAIGIPLRAIADDEAMPDLKTIAAWRLTNRGFRALIARARQLLVELLFDDVLLVVAQLGEPEAAGAGDTVRAKLRIDTLKWVIEQTAPAPSPAARKAEAAGKPGPERIRLVRVATGVPRADD